MLPSALIVRRQFARSVRQPSFLRRLCLLSASALNSSLFFLSGMDREHAPSGTPSDAKSFKINTCKKSLSYAILRSISPFRINTCKTVSKQRTLTTFRMNTYEKQGEGGQLLLTRRRIKGVCPERRALLRAPTWSGPSGARDLSEESHTGRFLIAGSVP